MYTICQVIPKCGSRTLETTKGSHYYGGPPCIFIKLRAQDCPYLFCVRRSDVGILNVRYLHWQIIQVRQCQSNPDCLPGHYACICCGGQGLWYMSSRHQPSLPTEIFHYNTKDHVTVHTLISYWHNIPAV